MFDTELTKYLARLSKIEFTEDEITEMSSQMTDIIKLMDTVKDFDRNEKTFALEAAAYTELRKDEARESFETEKILRNAKQVKNNSFVVPKVVS
ncbi:MAG: Asp-tRNA(Asn)/Glu-tRNA(Gln) amidotransferase subunit GatC [Oscillospiraceae bacterium]|nr:Asp-tRNA(Asn)/Glu-tRNA(Gln) amidotransferase subunit GatC [Oscillospiraceae bacterium]